MHSPHTPWIRIFENADSDSEEGSLGLARRSLDPSANPDRCFLCNKSTGKAYQNPLRSNSQYTDIFDIKQPFKGQLDKVIYCEGCADGMSGAWPTSYKPDATSVTFDHCIYCGTQSPRATHLFSAHIQPAHVFSSLPPA